MTTNDEFNHGYRESVLAPTSIQTKIILMAAGTMIVAFMLASYFIRDLVYQNIVNQKMTTVDILTASLVHDVKYDFDSRKPENVQEVIAKFTNYYRIIQSISFYDTKFLNRADSDLSKIGQPATDEYIRTALTRAKPDVHVTRSDWSNLGIRSVAPVIQGSRIVGAVSVDVSIQDIQAILATIYRRIAIVLAVTVVASSLLLYFLLRTNIRPRLQRLIQVTRHIKAGNYDVHVGDRQKDEIGLLSLAFEQMAAELYRSREKIRNHHIQLEQDIQEATAQLQTAYEELKNAQSQIVLNEKMASLGILIAGIAHEINTPVGAINNVTRNLKKNVHSLPRILVSLKDSREVPLDGLVALLEDLFQVTQETLLPPSYREIQELENLLKSHEIPKWQETAGVLTKLNFIRPEKISRHLETLKKPSLIPVIEAFGSMAQAARISESSSSKIQEIVRALKFYAYTDKDKVEDTQINESIRTALILLKSRLKHHVNVTADFAPDLPEIPCTSEIHQVWTNLLTNACDAIDERGEAHAGEISIRTVQDGADIKVTLSDNGAGIPEDKVEKIFDPFFTTKDIGKGTGLGLSIVSGILRRHNANIEVNSGGGVTVFQVSIPLAGFHASAPKAKTTPPSPEWCPEKLKRV